MCFIINFYLDNQQTILKYLKHTEINSNNILIMIRGFNIRNSNWDLLYLHYLIHTNMLQEVDDSLNLDLSILINVISTQNADNS